MMISLLKPKSLFARMLAIILIPLIVVQLITIWAFFGRHWDNITRYLATNLSADIAVVMDQIADDRSPEQLASTARFARSYFQFDTAWLIAAPPDSPEASTSYAGRQLRLNLNQRLDHPFSMDFDSDPDRITIYVQYPEGVYSLTASRKRLFSTTAFLVILWTVGTTILLACVAVLFLRNQMRSIERLAEAARRIGLGRPPIRFKVEGATEVRQAGLAFHAMSNRIQRQVSERVEMLAGVSHDLRTPLTRMKLSLAMLADEPARHELEKDIAEMEAMIEGYLHFASGSVSEALENLEVVELIQTTITRDFNNNGGNNGNNKKIHFTPPDTAPPAIPLRRMAFCRAISNLINNALIHGGNCFISVEAQEGLITILIDDDGDGIPKDMRRAALKPFARDINGKTSAGGIGLGLAIAHEAAMSHGGELLLGDAPQGGLRVRLQLPI